MPLSDNTLLLSYCNGFIATNANILANSEAKTEDEIKLKNTAKQIIEYDEISNVIKSIGVINKNKVANVNYEKDFVLEAYSLETRCNISCPFCGSVYAHKEGTTERTYKHVPLIEGKFTYIVAKIRGFQCQDCGKKFYDSPTFGYKEHYITDDLAKHIENLFTKANIAIKHIEEITNVNVKIIKEITNEYMNMCILSREAYLAKKGYKPSKLAADEFSIQKNYKYGTAVMDLATKEIIGLCEGKTKDKFKEIFTTKGLDYFSNVKAFALDMNAGFASVVKELFPAADVVYDKFHLFFKYMLDVLNKVRMRTYRQVLATKNKKDMSKKEKKAINKKAKEVKAIRHDIAQHGVCSFDEETKSFKCDEENADAVKLKIILNEYSDLGTAYKVKEYMNNIYKKCTTYEEAYKEWFELLSSCSMSTIDELKKFGENMLKKIQGIASYAKHKITSGPIEGMNNLIKVCKRIAYGYQDIKYFFTLIRFRSLPEEWRNPTKFH